MYIRTLFIHTVHTYVHYICMYIACTIVRLVVCLQDFTSTGIKHSMINVPGGGKVPSDSICERYVYVLHTYVCMCTCNCEGAVHVGTVADSRLVIVRVQSG